jgi:DNA-binding SARP family transcriptional activator
VGGDETYVEPNEKWWGGAIVDAKHAAGVFVRTLGAFQVICDGTPVSGVVWQSKKARDLLKILVARGRETSRELLIELLWPEVAPAKAGNRLSVLLWTLRNVLQPHARAGPLASNAGMVWLDRTHVNIDVEEFRTAGCSGRTPSRSSG